MSRRDWFVAAAFILCLGLGAWWLFANFERVEIEKRRGPHAEARQNPFLAARRLLRRMGIPAHSRRPNDPNALPLTKEEVFFIGSDRATYTEERNNQLLDWVESGGHLIVSARVDYSVDENELVQDDLLAKVGAVQVRVPRDAITAGATMEARIEPEGPELSLGENHPYRLRADADSWNSLAWDVAGDAIVHAHLGLGRITVLSDGRAFDNNSIGRYDHAEILLRLVGLTTAERVWIEDSSDMPMLLTWLWRHAPEALLTAALALLAMLWHAGARFGPVVDLPPLARRGLMEHIDASGRFFWRRGLRMQLLQALRLSVLNAAIHKHPRLAGLEAEQRCQRLADMLEIPKELIENALYGRLIENRGAFVQSVRVLAAIRKNL